MSYASDDDARAYGTRWAANKRRQVAYGRWEPPERADPAPVREHIANLRQSGLSVGAIAHLAGVSVGSLGGLIYPNHADWQDTITPERAARLLTIRPDLDRLPDRAHIDNTGTRRRIEALMLAGWSQMHIAQALDVSRQRVHTYRTGSKVTAATARTVRDLHHQWWDKPGPEVRATNLARRRGYVPTAVWDDIDDPNETPDTGAATQPGATAENIAWLLRHDPEATPRQLAHRLGITKDGIDRALRRNGRRDLIKQLTRNAENTNPRGKTA